MGPLTKESINQDYKTYYDVVGLVPNLGNLFSKPDGPKSTRLNKKIKNLQTIVFFGFDELAFENHWYSAPELGKNLTSTKAPANKRILNTHKMDYYNMVAYTKKTFMQI